MKEDNLILRAAVLTSYPLVIAHHTFGKGHIMRVMSLGWHEIKQVDLHPVIDEARGTGDFERDKLRKFLLDLDPKVGTDEPLLRRLL